MRSKTLIYLACLMLAGGRALAAGNPAGEENEETPATVEETPKSKKAKIPKPPLEIPADIPHEEDVAYLEGDRKEKADLYFPMDLPEGRKAPALIIIHGGGFNDGDKRKYRELNFCTNAAQRGYLAMSINYKLRKSQGQVTWPQNIQDAKEAVRWLRLNAERLKIDPERIGAMGGSAGGNVAAMLTLTRPEDGFDGAGSRTHIPARIVCGVDFYGAVDLMTYHDMKMFAKTRDEAPDLYRKGSPTSYVRENAPPLLMIHGTGDETVKVEQSQILRSKLEAKGNPCPEYTINDSKDVDALKEKLKEKRHALVLIPNAPHTFDLAVSMKKDGPVMMDITDLVFDWLDRHLKPSTVEKKP
ncbi:MAG: alpha/beta hydrolase [Verrucomicrobia bacterium]|nr:alpha/beta hydrolase [Verrucomicrobiota bacterium]